MTALALTVNDSATMLRRNLKRAVRYPGLTVIVAALPIVFLLLFVFVFGGTLGAGLGLPSGGRAEYLAYVVPGTWSSPSPAVRRGRRSASPWT